MYVSICTLTTIFISALGCKPWVHTDISDLNPKPHSSFYFFIYGKFDCINIYFYLHSPQYSEAAKMDVFLGFIWFELIRIPNLQSQRRMETGAKLNSLSMFTIPLFISKRKTTNRNSNSNPSSIIQFCFFSFKKILGVILI